MGEVYLTQDTKLDRQVALKVLPVEIAANEDRMRRFVQEAKSAAALNHPNIAHIYEIGEVDGLNFIAMEFVDGRTLREAIHDNKTDLKTLLKHLLQVADGLAKAHGSGIVHRDLKPDNVMITRDGHAKILDFGLAKLIDAVPESSAESGEAATAIMPAQLSTPGMIMGTVGYMSPEQARAKAVDQRSDIFSFGCVLYEATTGRKPFAGDSIVDTLHKIIYDPAPAITDFNPSASIELQRVIRKCLAKEPEKRYQTIRDTANDLEELLAEMKGANDFERSVAPSPREISNSVPGSTATGRAQSTASVTQQSSAEYIVSGFKQHKLVVLITLLLLVGFGVGSTLYLRSRNNSKTIESVAVMPFVNETGNADLEYLSDGMSETLINGLSQIPNLNVKARSSVFRYKGKELDPKKIAADLNVQAILTGRVTERDDQLTLSLELIDASSENVLWSQQYNRKQSELVTLQSEIARDVSNKLKSKLSGEDVAKVQKNYTTNPEAYQLYLKGKFYWNKRTAEGLKQAVNCYQQAIEKDPNYALAYSGLAETFVLFSSYDVAPADDSMPQAKAAALRALEIDDSLAEAHTALGFYFSNYEWDRLNSEKEYRRAIELKPNYSTAHHWFGADLSNVKRMEESLIEMKRAEELDPLSGIIGTNLGDMLVFARRYDEAIAQYKRVLLRNPNFAYAHRALGWAYGSKGMYEEALTETRAAIQMTNLGKGFFGLWLARSGNRTEALKVLADLKKESGVQYVQNYDFALLYIGLGDKEQALNYLEKHMVARAETANSYAVAPELDELRSEPRFKAMLKKMNLPE